MNKMNTLVIGFIATILLALPQTAGASYVGQANTAAVLNTAAYIANMQVLYNRPSAANYGGYGYAPYIPSYNSGYGYGYNQGYGAYASCGCYAGYNNVGYGYQNSYLPMNYGYQNTPYYGYNHPYLYGGNVLDSIVFSRFDYQAANQAPVYKYDNRQNYNNKTINSYNRDYSQNQTNVRTQTNLDWYETPDQYLPNQQVPRQQTNLDWYELPDPVVPDRNQTSLDWSENPPMGSGQSQAQTSLNWYE